MHPLRMRPDRRTAPRLPGLPCSSGIAKRNRAEARVATPVTGKSFTLPLFRSGPEVLAEEAADPQTSAPIDPETTCRKLIGACALLPLFPSRTCPGTGIGTHSRFTRQHHPTLKALAWQGKDSSTESWQPKAHWQRNLCRRWAHSP